MHVCTCYRYVHVFAFVTDHVTDATLLKRPLVESKARDSRSSRGARARLGLVGVLQRRARCVPCERACL